MFFILFFLIIILVIIILSSKLQITISNLDISTERKEKIKKDFQLYIEVIILKKIKILKIDMKRIKPKKINTKKFLEKVKKIEQTENNKDLIKKSLKNLKELQVEIKKADLKLEIGTEDAALTAISVGIISSILGTILKKQKFKIIPQYQNKNIFNLKLNCIFRINLIHYIYKTILKGRDKNERKSSNRRTYAYSNE